VNGHTPGSTTTGGNQRRLVGDGFAIALLGAIGVMLYILGASNLMVGQTRYGLACLLGASLLVPGFLWRCPPIWTCLTESAKQLLRGSGVSKGFVR
jgi:hypothetical protein